MVNLNLLRFKFIYDIIHIDFKPNLADYHFFNFH